MCTLTFVLVEPMVRAGDEVWFVMFVCSGCLLEIGIWEWWWWVEPFALRTKQASVRSKKVCKNMYGSGRITELRLNVILFVYEYRYETRNCVPVHFSTGFGYFSITLSYVFRVQSASTSKVKTHKEGLFKYLYLLCET